MDWHKRYIFGTILVFFHLWSHRADQMRYVAINPRRQTHFETTRKSLYPLALNMFLSQRLAKSSVADIQRHGGHLYAKRYYDVAMGQFVRCIGWTEASRVIRKVGRLSFLFVTCRVFMVVLTRVDFFSTVLGRRISYT
jgi:hypothetical protein